MAVNKNPEMENLSLFDLDDMAPENEGNSQNQGEQLEVVQMSFGGVDSTNWRALFQGYDHLRAITYSSGIGFVSQLLELFEDAEIIFGCEDMISYTFQEVMAYQCKLIERMRETTNKLNIKFEDRLDKGNLRLFVAHDKLSHEKIYLLSAEDGRKRVIMGSANMSFAAFTGKQRENICYVDGDEAYEWYLDCYNELRDLSTDQISKKGYLISDAAENLTEIPIAKTVQVKKAMVIEAVEESREEVHFALDVRKLAGELSPYIPKPDKKGKLLLSPEKIRKVRRSIVAARDTEKITQEEFPRLQVFPDEGTAQLNDTKIELSQDQSEIKRDVDLFLQYMDGYQNFHGDVGGLQKRYYEFANWFFCSPFMAGMRDMASRYNQNRLPYPVFGLIYGQSKAGKTSFLETLLKMMIGQKPKMSAPEFTRTNIEGMQRKVQGAPIIVDDLTSQRFNQHAIETIKNDDFGIADHMVHYPAVVISANEDVKAVSPEIIRRTVICRVQAGLTNMEVMRSNLVRIVQRDIGTAFYDEYLRRMLSVAADLQEVLKDDEGDGSPDILAASSEVMWDIINENLDRELPAYVRKLTLEDYFGERVTGGYAIQTIKNAWNINRSAFDINEKVHELRYNTGDTWDAGRLIKELPENLEAHKSREWIIMDLEEARTFFGVDFRKSWLDRFIKRT